MTSELHCPDCKSLCVVMAVPFTKFFAVKCQCCTVTGPRRALPDGARSAFIRVFHIEEQLTLPEVSYG